MAIVATNPARAVATALDVPIETVADGAVASWPVPDRAAPVQYKAEVRTDLYERDGMSMWAVNLRACTDDGQLLNPDSQVNVLVVAVVMLANVQATVMSDRVPAADRLRTMATQGRHDEIAFTLVPTPPADDKMPTQLAERLIDAFTGDDQTAE